MASLRLTVSAEAPLIQPKEATAWKIAAGFQLAGCEVELSGSYPGWKPDMNSAILSTMKDTYNKLYGRIPEIKAIHAGLECGIIMGVYPKLTQSALARPSVTRTVLMRRWKSNRLSSSGISW